MGKFTQLLIVTMISMVAAHSNPQDARDEGGCPGLQIIPREKWGAEEPKSITLLERPLDNVIILDADVQAAGDGCAGAMRELQGQGWADIFINFAICGDAIYEGRGWNNEAAHTLNYNDRSYGIAFVGDYSDGLPSTKALLLAEELIRCATERGDLRSDYKLFAHRDVRPSMSPGKRLYEEIQTWPHYQPPPEQGLHVQDDRQLMPGVQNRVPGLRDEDEIVLRKSGGRTKQFDEIDLSAFGGFG